MNKIPPLLFYTIIILLFYSRGFGQDIIKISNNRLIKNWTINNGLPSNSILKLSNTPKGFLFIASPGSISFFDGKKFSNYTDIKLTNLQNNQINDYYTDTLGSYWIATRKGLFIFDGSNFKVPKGIENQQIPIKMLTGNQNGTLFLVSDSGEMFRYQNHSLENLNIIYNFKDTVVTFVFAENTGQLWITTKSNNLYLLENKKLRKILDCSESEGITCAFQNQDGEIYFGTRKGIFVYRNKKIELLTPEIKNVTQIVSDKNGILYFSNAEKIYFKAKNEKEFRNLAYFPLNTDIKIKCLYFDNSNSMWIGTDRDGLFQIRNDFIETYNSGLNENFTAVCGLQNSNILLGTDAGNIFEFDNNEFKKYDLQTNLEDVSINAIFRDRTNSIWVCTDKGLLKIEDKKEIFLNKIGNSTISATCIAETNDGFLWMGTKHSGIFKMNSHMNVIKKIDESNGLFSNSVEKIIAGKIPIYIVTKQAVNILSNDSVNKMIASSNNNKFSKVNDLFQAEDGSLYIASSHGIEIHRNGNLSRIDEINNIRLNETYGVTEVGNYLWISSKKGIFSINKANIGPDFVQNLTFNSEYLVTEDGKTIIPESVPGKFIKLDDERIVALISSGICIINALNYNTYKTQLSLSITRINTENKSYPGENETIKLPANTKSVEIEYSLLNFIDPSNFEIQSKLEPFDDEWHYSGDDMNARYTNLPAGEYIFKLTAINKSNPKIHFEDSIYFVIKPAFFETLLFKLMLVFILLLLFAFFYFIKVKTLNQRLDILEQQVVAQSKTISDNKSNLQSYIQQIKKLQLDINLKEDEIILATNNMEQAYLNLKILSDLGKKITSFLDINKVLYIVYQNISTMMDSDIVAIGTYNHDKTKLVFSMAFYRGKKIENIESEVLNDRCMLSFALENNREIITNDIINEYPQFVQTFPIVSSIKGISSAITIPLRTKGKKLGIFTVQSFRRNSYNEYHFNMLRNLAVYMSIAIENSQNYQELILQKNELEQVNASKDKMFSIIGHDLRGPVGTIKGFLDFLIANPDKANKENTRIILLNMQQSLGSTYTLLDNLFVWARNQKGQIEFNPEAFEINRSIEDSITLLNESGRLKNIKIISQVNVKEKVFADKIMITTVLRNLLANAIKFTPMGGMIQVTAENKLQKFANGLDELVEIQIIDTGVGIDEDKIVKILESNEMYTTDGTNLEKGSGLGLKICVDFLKKHNKELNIENNDGINGKPMNGATFRFFIDKA